MKKKKKKKEGISLGLFGLFWKFDNSIHSPSPLYPMERNDESSMATFFPPPPPFSTVLHTKS